MKEAIGISGYDAFAVLPHTDHLSLISTSLRL
jgi:hypothetical protein